MTSKTTKKLLSKLNDIDNPWRPGSNTETVVTTFHVTFNQIQKQSPLAGSLLQCMACMDRQGILREILSDFTKLQTDEKGLKYEDHENLLDDALEKLINFSILQPMTDNEKLYEIHALVHFSAVHLMDVNPEKNVATIYWVTEILFDKLRKEGAEIFARKLKLRRSIDWRIYSHHAMAVVVARAKIFQKLGFFVEAKAMYMEALKIRQRILEDKYLWRLNESLAISYLEEKIRELQSLEIEPLALEAPKPSPRITPQATIENLESADTELITEPTHPIESHSQPRNKKPQPPEAEANTKTPEKASLKPQPSRKSKSTALRQWFSRQTNNSSHTQS
jgi:tetratricopeptide (TPR) repeat protein